MISKHFKRSEFACRCGCGFDTVDVELLEVLEDVRTHFNLPVIISSACRCREHNEGVQKIANSNYRAYSSRSKHMYGIAADIKVKGAMPSLVYLYLSNKYPNKYGIGSYNTFTHIDIRPTKARF